MYRFRPTRMRLQLCIVLRPVECMHVRLRVLLLEFPLFIFSIISEAFSDHLYMQK